MPFKSEAQRRKFHVLESEGKLPAGTAARWEHHTPKAVKKKLPYHVGALDALATYGVKVAFWPAVGAALATGARMAIPWLARTFASQGVRSMATGAAMNAAGSALGSRIQNGSWQGAGRAAMSGGAQGAFMSAMPQLTPPGLYSPRMPPAIGQV